MADGLGCEAERLVRTVGAIVAGELAFTRGAEAAPRACRMKWDGSTDVTGPEIGVDSAEFFAVASMVGDFFGIAESGLEMEIREKTTLGDWAATGASASLRSVAFRTSGSTGTPRRIEHRRRDLAHEAAWFAERLSDRGRWVSLVAPNHIFGFIHGVLVPAAAGAEVADGEFMLRTSVVRSLKPGDVVVATPPMWADLARLGTAPPPGVIGVSSGAPMPDETWRSLLDIGYERITEVYGSTETGAIATRESPDDSFELLPTWLRDGDWLRRGGEEFGVPDRIVWTGDRTLRVAGRLDGAVQVGGVNVSPEHVRSRLIESGLVDDAAVRPFEITGGGGQRLKAFVVPAIGVHSEAIEAWSRANLSAVERPVSFTLGPKLPTGPLGKPGGWEDGSGATLAA
ncbi:MAG: AMP-binding protein [Planctomycetota bacterium]